MMIIYEMLYSMRVSWEHDVQVFGNPLWLGTWLTLT